MDCLKRACLDNKYWRREGVGAICAPALFSAQGRRDAWIDTHSWPLYCIKHTPEKSGYVLVVKKLQFYSKQTSAFFCFSPLLDSFVRTLKSCSLLGFRFLDRGISNKFQIVDSLCVVHNKGRFVAQANYRISNKLWETFKYLTFTRGALDGSCSMRQKSGPFLLPVCKFRPIPNSVDFNYSPQIVICVTSSFLAFRLMFQND